MNRSKLTLCHALMLAHTMYLFSLFISICIYVKQNDVSIVTYRSEFSSTVVVQKPIKICIYARVYALTLQNADIALCMSWYLCCFQCLSDLPSVAIFIGDIVRDGYEFSMYDSATAPAAYGKPPLLFSWFVDVTTGSSLIRFV